MSAQEPAELAELIHDTEKKSKATIVHDWDVIELDPREFPAPSRYDVDITTNCWGKHCVCKLCGIRVVASDAGRMPKDEPGLPPCRSAASQTPPQLDAEGAFLALRAAAQGLRLRFGEEIPRTVAVGISTLCVWHSLERPESASHPLHANRTESLLRGARLDSDLGLLET